MKLPYATRAVIDLGKLRDYCLRTTHPRGRHKARVFASASGLGSEEAEALRAALMRAAQEEEVVPTGQDEFGQRYVLDLELATATGTALIRSAWIVRADEEFPRFVTCHVLC